MTFQNFMREIFRPIPGDVQALVFLAETAGNLSQAKAAAERSKIWTGKITDADWSKAVNDAQNHGLRIQHIVTYDAEKDDMYCTCGNTASTDGFVAVDANLTECDPNQYWDGTFACQSCRATVKVPQEGWTE